MHTHTHTHTWRFYFFLVTECICSLAWCYCTLSVLLIRFVCRGRNITLFNCSSSFTYHCIFNITPRCSKEGSTERSKRLDQLSCRCHLKGNKIQEPLAVACFLFFTSSLPVPSHATLYIFFLVFVSLSEVDRRNQCTCLVENYWYGRAGFCLFVVNDLINGVYTDLQCTSEFFNFESPFFKALKVL